MTVASFKKFRKLFSRAGVGSSLMKRKLKIGIIGVGNIGGALTRHFTRLGHNVVVANHAVCMESTLCFCQ